VLASQGAAAHLRVLGPADLPAALAVLAQDPVVNVFAEYRARITSLDPRWLGGEMWGYDVDGTLASLCHVGANLVPVTASREACRAFADRALAAGRSSSTIVGPRRAVEWMWAHLESTWGTPRDERWDQPHLVISHAPDVVPDPEVRRTPQWQADTLYPACVAMYTEEVGVSPELDGGAGLYRARVGQLVRRGWSFSRIEDDRVLFKAEVACVTESAAQIQGVYVDPELRGQGLATRGMAAVVNEVLREIAPTVSLYVNGHNVGARKAYERVGFEQTDTFSTLMF
jgi:predicted GNAT family acetyltransferase